MPQTSESDSVRSTAIVLPLSFYCLTFPLADTRRWDPRGPSRSYGNRCRITNPFGYWLFDTEFTTFSSQRTNDKSYHFYAATNAIHLSMCYLVEISTSLQ